VREFIANHDHVFVVEQNRDAQMRTLLVNELEIDPARWCRCCTTTARRSPRASSPRGHHRAMHAAGRQQAANKEAARDSP
jgi:hypothetical protein